MTTIELLQKRRDILIKEVGLLPMSKELIIYYDVKFSTIEDDIMRIRGFELIQKIEERKKNIALLFSGNDFVISHCLSRFNKEIEKINKDMVNYVRIYPDTPRKFYFVETFFNKV